jgi:type IV secretion system protein VirB10
MSDPLDAVPAAPSAPKENPEALVLRGKPRPVVRFRKGLIAGMTGAIATALIALSWVALQPPSFRKSATAIESDGPAKAESDALANVPATYSDVPRLGPPLPGDLGRPILEHQRSLGESIPPSVDPAAAEAAQARSAAEAERQRVEAARQAARFSPVIVQLAQGGAATAPMSAEGPSPAMAAPENSSSPAATIPASQQRKMEFASSRTSGDINPHELVPTASRWMLSAGTLIPASLITGLDSDLPGTVLAQVTENVRDSATGRTVLVPQGARLIGRYDSVVAYGQRRALVVWTRIVLPDGSSIGLDNMPATDTSGYAGLEDKVASHGWQLLKGIAMSTVLGVGTQLSLGSGESDLFRAIRESTQQNVAHAGDQITSRNLDVQPTIRVRPGWPVRVIVNKDLVLQPWRG